MFLRLAALAIMLTTAACTDLTGDLADPVEPIGDFKLGFSEVVAPNARRILISETVTPEDWIAAIDDAVETRFARFSGGKFYHFGISVEEYSIAIRAPIVPSKSAVAVRVTVWEDETATKLNPETEIISSVKIFESKVFTTREQKITWLAEDIARQIEIWLRKQHEEEGWFGPDPVPAAPAPDAAEAG